MQLAITQTALPPQTTGHPLGLPEAESLPDIKMIKPITKRGDLDAAMAEGRPPDQFWSVMNGEPDPDHIAPPSIMQIKISMILQEQASETIPDPANKNIGEDTSAKPEKPAQVDGAPKEKEFALPKLPAYEEAAGFAPDGAATTDKETQPSDNTELTVSE